MMDHVRFEEGALAIFFSGLLYAHADYYFSPCKMLLFRLTKRTRNLFGSARVHEYLFFFKLPTPLPQKSKGPLLNRVKTDVRPCCIPS